MKDYDAAEVLRWLAMRRWSATWLTSELCTAASYDRGGTAAAALLAAGADRNSVSREYPALMWAMLAGNAAVVRALCAAGADVHARYEGDGGHGVVSCIATALSNTPPSGPERDYVASLRALADAGRDITRCVAQGRATGTLRAAAMCAAERVLSLLLDAGADVNDQSDLFRTTPLYAAVEMPVRLLSATHASPRSKACAACAACCVRAPTRACAAPMARFPSMRCCSWATCASQTPFLRRRSVAAPRAMPL